MPTWKCKRCDMRYHDAEQPPYCPMGPCPMELQSKYSPNVIAVRQIVAIAAMLLLLPFGAITYALGQALIVANHKLEAVFDGLVAWGEK